METHTAWDLGIRESLGPLYEVPEERTRTTVCGRRVRVGRITNSEPTCPACQDQLKKERTSLEMLNSTMGS